MRRDRVVQAVLSMAEASAEGSLDTFSLDNGLPVAQSRLDGRRVEAATYGDKCTVGELTGEIVDALQTDDCVSFDGVTYISINSYVRPRPAK